MNVFTLNIFGESFFGEPIISGISLKVQKNNFVFLSAKVQEDHFIFKSEKLRDPFGIEKIVCLGSADITTTLITPFSSQPTLIELEKYGLM